MSTSPSIAPYWLEQDAYLLIDDFGGGLGCSWRETDIHSAGRETLIRDLVNGEYNHPVRIVAFNTSEGWSRDVTVDIADELRRRYAEFGAVTEMECSSGPARAGAHRPFREAAAAREMITSHVQWNEIAAVAVLNAEELQSNTTGLVAPNGIT